MLESLRRDLSSYISCLVDSILLLYLYNALWPRSSMSFRHEAQLFILNTKTIHWAILFTRQKREALWYQYNKRKHQCLIYQRIHLKTRLFYTFLLTKRGWTIDFLPNSVSCPFTVNWKSKKLLKKKHFILRQIGLRDFQNKNK